MTNEQKIKKLRKQGLKYKEISKIVGCSQGLISYYLSEGAKERKNQYLRKYRAAKHPY